jgi:CRISPR-associated protein Cas1
MTILTEKPTLFVVSRRNDLLKKHGKAFQIRDSETSEIRKTVPALGVRDIMICGNLTIEAEVFHLAQEHSIPIHFVSQGGKFKGSMIFDFSKNVFLRSKQFHFNQNHEKKFFLAQKFVAAKIINQNTVLQKMRAKGRIESNFANIKTLDELRGHEGATARKYFSIWQKENLIKHPELEFPGRKKFPATDPINSLLSFCFTLLHGEIHTQLSIAGLDPFIAFLHEQSYGHASLASDFNEIFRGPIEHFVLRTLNRQELDPKNDFEIETGKSVKLSREGFQKFFPKWVEFLRKEEFLGEKNLTQVIEKDVRKLVHFLMGDEPDFEPFVWKK